MAARQHHDTGITLIEVLLVVMILGLLAAVVVFSVRGTAERGQSAACDADAQTLATAAEAFFAQHSDSTIPGTGDSDDRYEVTLASRGFLRATSQYFDLDHDGTVASVSGSPCVP